MSLVFLIILSFQPWKVNFSDPKALWYLDALSGIEACYQKVRIAVVWSEKWENADGTWSDLRVNSSMEALAAYRQGISKSYFLGVDNLTKFKNYFVVPARGCFVGAYIEEGLFEDSVSIEKLERFAILTGKKPAFIPVSIFFGNRKIPETSIRAVLSFGAIPMIRLMPWGRPYEEGKIQKQYSLDNIIRGNFDSFLMKIAHFVASLDNPVFITFEVEMNGDWFPWSGIFNGAGKMDGYGNPDFPDGPERYRDAYRHIVELFRKAGAKNAIWYFQPDASSSPEEPWNFIDRYYPGDQYVDWLGVSVYGAQTNKDDWVSFKEILDRVYTDLTILSPEKPIMISEWGVMEPTSK